MNNYIFNWRGLCLFLNRLRTFNKNKDFIESVQRQGKACKGNKMKLNKIYSGNPPAAPLIVCYVHLL